MRRAHASLLLAWLLALPAWAVHAQSVALTPAEQAWLRGAPPVVVGVQTDYAPFSFVDDTGNAAGYANELFKLAAAKVGLRYRFATAEPWSALLPQARRGDVDVLTCLWRTPEREGFLRYVTPPYLRHTVGWAVRIGALDPPDNAHTRGKVIVLVRDFAINDILRKRFPQAIYLEADSAADALKLVSFGKADAYVDNVGLVNYLSAQQGFANVRVRDTFDLPAADYYMAVRRDTPLLQSILAKGLDAVTQQERRELEDRWLHEHVPLSQLIRPYLARVLLVVLAIAMVLAWLGYSNRRLAREVELRRAFQADAQAHAAALERRGAFQRLLLDAAQAAILVMDGDGRWVVFNRFAEGLLGWRADEILGRVVRAVPEDVELPPDAAPPLVHPEQVQRSLALLQKAHGAEVPGDWRAMYMLAEMQLPPQRLDMLHKDGHRVPVVLSLARITDADGQPAGLIAIANDLAEQVRLEEQLRQSETRAQEANQAKSEFLAAMSHEIRTPMIGVTGMVEILAHTPLEPEQRNALNVIQSSAQSLLQIIGDILDFSKIEAGRLELSAAPVDLRRLLQLTVANFSGSASSKGLTLTCRIDPRIGPAHVADGLRLRQILGNFLSNAIKFTAQGSVQAALELRAGQSEGDALCFRVSDTGIGVSAEQQRRLFEPFAQADGDTSRRYGGTGLGLAISRRLAELMGGVVRMESVAGLGTTMRLDVALPRASPDAIEEEPLTVSGGASFAPRRLPTIVEAEREGSLVLLVDDHPTNRMVIARQLALAGYATECAEDGDQGFALWRSGRFALVLSDVHMPRRDGYALARAIRAEEARTGQPRTPLVSLTASALKGEAERCFAAGMDDFLAKPVGIAALATTLQRWLPHTSGADTHAAIDPLPQLDHPPPLDASVLHAITNGDPVAMRAVLDDFLAATAEDLAGLEHARQSADLPALGRQAHKIKGAAALVGATELAAVAAGVETAAQAGDWSKTALLAADLTTAAERLRLHVAERLPA